MTILNEGVYVVVSVTGMVDKGLYPVKFICLFNVLREVE
jgi:hypothetical protein